ncbi:hypothetical protein BGW42_000328 [Actinomortierella wolfii]|nr:hypothetical protein BGW42_000328 [Actinomortierella wolfii]
MTSLNGSSTTVTDAALHSLNYKVPIVDTPWTNNAREKQEYDEQHQQVQTTVPTSHITQGPAASALQSPPSFHQQQQQQQQRQQQQPTSPPQPLVRMSIDPISHQVTYSTINTLPQHVGAVSTQHGDNESNAAQSVSPISSSTAGSAATASAVAASVATTASPSSTTLTPAPIATTAGSQGLGGSILSLPKLHATRTQTAIAAATVATAGVALASRSSSSSSSSSRGLQSLHNSQSGGGTGTPASVTPSAASSPSPSRSSSTSNRAAMEMMAMAGDRGHNGVFSVATGSNGNLHDPASPTTVTNMSPGNPVPQSSSSGAGPLSPLSVTPPLTPQMMHQNVVVLPDQLNGSNDPTAGVGTSEKANGSNNTMVTVAGGDTMVQSPLSTDRDPYPLTMPPLAQSTTAQGGIPIDDSFLHNYAPIMTGLVSEKIPEVGEVVDVNRSDPSLTPSVAALDDTVGQSTLQTRVRAHPPANRDQLLGQQQAYQQQEMQRLEQVIGATCPSDGAPATDPLGTASQQQRASPESERITASFVPTPLDESKEYVRHGLNTTIDTIESTGNRNISNGAVPRPSSVDAVQPIPGSTRAPPIPRATHPNYNEKSAATNKAFGIENGARVIITHTPTTTNATSSSSVPTSSAGTAGSPPPSTMPLNAGSPPPPSVTVQFEAGAAGQKDRDQDRFLGSNRDSLSSMSRQPTLIGSQYGNQAHRPLSNVLARTGTQSSLFGLITHDLKQSSEQTHIEEGAGPLTLIAIGKTGQGKSSLLNRIMGTSELKASASVRAVTKGIAERSGWGRFEDTRRVLVTLADTPGLADTEGDDEKNIPILKEYIKSIGTRLGVSAFLLVFKIDSGVDMVITILTTFNEIMQEFPYFWENVVLVFTGCDYRRNVQKTKELYHAVLQNEINERFFKNRPSTSSNTDANGSSPENRRSSNGSGNNSSEHPKSQEDGTMGSPTVSSPTVSSPTSPTSEQRPCPEIPMVFLTTAEPVCGFALGERCDCKAQNAFLNNGLRRLWYKVRDVRRWVIKPDCQEDDFDHS